MTRQTQRARRTQQTRMRVVLVTFGIAFLVAGIAGTITGLLTGG